VGDEEVLHKFYNIINSEDWDEDAFVSPVKEQPPVVFQSVLIPTPHPHYFIHLNVGMEYNPELGDDLYGEI
tara:strand:+ start:387 stop:599 length:213 start_codon:yes stop_codon:yes gene_type:complete